VINLRLKIKNIAVLSIVFLTLISLVFVMHINRAFAEEDGAAQVLSHSSYIEYGSYRITHWIGTHSTGNTTFVSGDLFHVVGEVQNVIEENIKDVTIKIIFYDEYGAVIDADYMYSEFKMLDILTPGQKAPFEKVLLDAEASKKVARYEFLVESNITMEEPALLEIPNHSSHMSSLGTCFEVVGEVENIGSENVEDTKIFATFYDQQGTVIGATLSRYGEIDTLVPGQKLPFSLSYYGREGIPERIPNYSLCAEGTKTTKEPYREFQIISQNVEPYPFQYVVNGVVKNVGEQDATDIEGVASFYDSNGTMIAKDNIYIERVNLAAGQTTPFMSVVGEEEVAEKVDSYTLQFQCNEVIEIPEPEPTESEPTTPETTNHETEKPPDTNEPLLPINLTTEMLLAIVAIVAIVIVALVAYKLGKRNAR
jgi:hypothetical protein